MLDAFVQREKLGTWKSETKRKCLLLKSQIEDQEVVFLKPQEFMNRSG
jgi:peptidyl-tRNA hydrolase